MLHDQYLNLQNTSLIYNEIYTPVPIGYIVKMNVCMTVELGKTQHVTSSGVSLIKCTGIHM